MQRFGDELLTFLPLFALFVVFEAASILFIYFEVGFAQLSTPIVGIGIAVI